MVRILSVTTPSLTIQLDCGQTVSVEAFMYRLTYAGLIDGAPDESYSAWMIERA